MIFDAWEHLSLDYVFVIYFEVFGHLLPLPEFPVSFEIVVDVGSCFSIQELMIFD